MSCDLFLLAGEKSGDLHGEKVMASLKALAPHLCISGVGGPRMRSQGLQCVLPMEEFQVMGFVDVFLALPKLIRQFYQVADAILRLNPKAVLFIDYPGLNLRLARYLKKRGYQGKLCHYICPSVWAWGKKRIPLMGKTLDLLLTILPFESRYFRSTSLSTEFVGHPLVQRLKEHPYAPLDLPAKTLALFPGSRKKELVRNLPLQLKVCRQLKAQDPSLFFALSLSDERYRPLIQQMLDASGISDTLLVPIDRTYDLMKTCYAAIAKSGTVTLELALHGVPTVVTYAISPLDLFIARDLLRIRLPHYCLVNIIADKRVFPELFGPHFTEQALLFETEQMLNNPNTRALCQQECAALADLLKGKNASAEVAQHLLRLCC